MGLVKGTPASLEARVFARDTAPGIIRPPGGTLARISRDCGV